MAIKCAWASINENGRAIGGAAGDQTKNEVKTGAYYYFGQTKVLRPKTIAEGKKIANCAKQIAANNNIGYDQGNRTSLYEQAKKHNFDCSKIKAKCETDCSAMTAVCINAAGIKISKDCWTGNLEQACKETGRFNVLGSAYYNEPERLRQGDIVLNPKSHVIIVISDGTKSKQAKKKLAVDGTLDTADIKALQKWLHTTQDGVISGQKKSLKKYHTALKSAQYKRLNASGSQAVRALQRLLCVKVNGQLDAATIKALQKWLNLRQKAYKLVIDGSLGPKTVKALQTFLNAKI